MFSEVGQSISSQRIIIDLGSYEELVGSENPQFDSELGSLH